MGATPAILLTGPSNELLAQQLHRDQAIIAVGQGSSSKTAPAGNPHVGKYTPVCSVFLEDTGITGNSATAYYLLAQPAVRAAIQVVFLNGVRVPTVESSDMEFNTLGIQYRCVYDFGVAKMDNKAGIKVTGA